MDNIKLVAIDLDGTFLTDTKEIPAANIEAVHHIMDKGIKVVICTGRTLPGTRRFIDQIDFGHENEYAIIQNGAATHRLPEYDVVAATYQSMENRQKLVRFFFESRIDTLQLVAFDQENLFLIGDQTPSEFVQKDAETLATPITFISQADFDQVEGIFKMMVLGPKADLDAWNELLTQEIKAAFDVVRSQPIIIEFLSNDTNKATALKALSEDLGITRTEIMAIGDEQNDVEMLKWVKHSVAMGNASPAIKELCLYETASNNEGGVAAALRKLF
ncbi:Cof-type HAD-IIB family hydrolase [Globicatella sanguinis]